MNSKIKLYQERRYKRLLKRLDADVDQGRWVTTEENHKIHLNEKGVPDKGNPYVIATMTGKKPRVGISETTKKIQDCFGKYGSTSNAGKILDSMPDGSVVVLRRKGGKWSGPTTETYTKDSFSGDFKSSSGDTYDGEQMAYMLENKYGDEPLDFDAFDPAEENAAQESKPSFMDAKHKKFAGTAMRTGWDAGYSYKGDASSTVEWFNKHSNGDKLITDMTPNQKEAFKEWTRGYFMRGQQHHGWDAMGETAKQFTQDMDDVLDRATVDRSIVVTRLTNAALILGKDNKMPLLSELRAMEGKNVISKGAMSCAAAAQGLKIGGRDKNVELKISVPGGSVGAGMWIGDNRINGWGADQREFVINRDVQLKVGRTTYNSKRGVYEVELQYVRTLPHDYGTSGRIELKETAGPFDDYDF